MIRYFCDICDDEIVPNENKYPDMGFEFETEKIFGKLNVEVKSNRKGHSCRNCLVDNFKKWLESEESGHMEVGIGVSPEGKEELPQ